MQPVSGPQFSANLLVAERISFGTMGGRPLVEELSFELRPAHLALVRGANGAGKSTLLRVCLGMHKLSSGKIHRSVRTADMEYLPQLQNTGVHLPFTLGDVIRTGAVVTTDNEVEALGLLLREDLSKSWNTASGGERQKALLTRSLLSPAKVLLLDEPFNHLDGAARLRLAELISQTVAEGRTVMMVSHDEDIEFGRMDASTIRIGGAFPC
jgi:ABC-type Mn2+/Zn2+ transport system ATPase subunit